MSTSWNGWPWVTGIFVIVAAVLIWALLAWRQRRRSQRVCRLEVCNEGNVRSRYELWAEDPAGALRFTFTVGGARLYGTAGLPSPIPGAAGAPSPKGRGGRPSPWPARRSRPAGGGRGIDLVANLLSTLGGLLPREAGAPLRRAAGQIRRGRASVRRAGYVASQAGQLRPQGQAAPPRQEVQAAPEAEARASETSADPGAQTPRAQTPVVEAGETLAVDLLIRPARPYQTAYYPFVVTSRSLEATDAPPVVAEGSVHVVGPTLFQRFGPLLVTMTIVMMTLFIVSLSIAASP